MGIQRYASARQGHVLARALLFVPALGLLAFTLWQRSETPPARTSLDEPSVPMRTGEVGDIDGWDGLVTLEGGAPLRLRLEPLHPEAGRQAFDAKALAAVLRDGGGPTPEWQADGGEPESPAQEPWRLTLSVAARPGAAAASEPVVTSLRSVRIDGLEPLVSPGASEGSPSVEGPVDPLVALMEFPDAPLRPGETCDLVFWGQRPEGPVRAILPGIGDVQLLEKARAANRSTVSIARLDGRSNRRSGGAAKEVPQGTGEGR